MTPPMTLEETKVFLRNFLAMGRECLEACRKHAQNTGTVRGWDSHGWTDTIEKQEAHVHALDSALHHLEAGNLERIKAIRDVLVILNTEPLGYRTEGEHRVTEALMDRLVAKVRALSPQPQQEGQG